MKDEFYEPDPAAIFGCALSLWGACRRLPQGDGGVNLSECYNGMDEFMRVVMKIGTRFEAWACAHIDFEELDDTWPYIMEARFGVACLAVSSSTALADFDDNSCLRVALHLRLPVKVGDGLPVPVDVTADNPVRNTPFRAFRIQTVREVAEDDFCEPFTTDDDPFDGHFMPPLFALYGVLDDHLLDHIADRSTYADAVELAEKLAPGVRFPKVPGFGPAKPF